MTIDPAGLEAGSTARSAAQVRVVRGAPDDLEVAALVAGLAAAAAELQSAPSDEPATDEWTNRARGAGNGAGARSFGGRRSTDDWRWSLRS